MVSNKPGLIAATILILLATSGACFETTNQDGIPFGSVDSIVRIKRSIDSSRYIIGSGAIVGESGEDYLILSNHHVTQKNRPLAVDLFRDGFIIDDDQSARAAESYLGSGLDISLTKIPKSEVPADMPSLPLADESYEPKVGDKIITIGCSDGRWPRARVGHIVEITGTGAGRRLVYLPNSIGGDSGSPILDATASKVIGVTTWSNGKYGIGQSVAGVNEGLKRAKQNKAPGNSRPRRPLLDFWRNGFEETATAWSPTTTFFVQENDDEIVDPFDDLTPRVDTPLERHRMLLRLQRDTEQIEANQKSFFPLLDQLRWFVRFVFWLSIGLIALVLIGHPATAWIFKSLFNFIGKGVENIKDAVDGDE